MEALIDEATARHAEVLEKERIAKSDPDVVEAQRLQVEYGRKCAVYDELLLNIADNNVADKIGQVKALGGIYATLHVVSFNGDDDYIQNRKKLVLSFDPYGKGTIFDILSESLPAGFKINISEPWHPVIYSFRLYISWSELSLWDEVNLYTPFHRGGMILMPCDKQKYKALGVPSQARANRRTITNTINTQLT